MIELSKLLAPGRISCHCDIQSKKRALQTVAELLGRSIEDEELSDMDIFDALVGRERLGSTSLGHGVALPHSRLASIEEPMAALITLADGVDYEADDGEPVDMLVGLLVPENCNNEHLQILANLAKHFSDAEFRKKIRQFQTDESDALYQHLQHSQQQT